MGAFPPDTIVGPFTARVRLTKTGPVAVVNESGARVYIVEGLDTEQAALAAAVAWAETQAASRRVAPRRPAKPRAMPTERISIDRLVEKFLRYFPDGFEDAEYLGEKSERVYKLAAKAKLDAAVTVEAALFADQAQCDSVKAVFGTNMLSRFENARAREVLASAEGPAYLRGAAQLVRGDVAGGLQTIRDAVAPHGNVSWPLATFLPSLWDTDRQIFLKIEATKRVAGWLGHKFCVQYAPQLEPAVHASLMDFADQTRASIAGLKPRDMIDVQSFIWVAAEYD
ncbi:MAG TPA: hypothetical protein VGO52_02140 [Hyphomonadaceae bacterium]|nr:hypothetical protein [Hyphomonadaceae bacterium]